MMKPHLHIPNNAPVAVSAELESTTFNFVLNLEAALTANNYGNASNIASLAQKHADAEPPPTNTSIDERRWFLLRRADIKLAVLLAMPEVEFYANDKWQKLSGSDYLAARVAKAPSLYIKTRREAEELEQQYVQHEFLHLARAMRAIQPSLP